jgi:hypothetical protein
VATGRPIKGGSYVVQHIQTLNANGKEVYNFWEAWKVPATSKYSEYYPDPNDDIFRTHSGWTTNSEARFYEGLNLQSSFRQNAPGTTAGDLRTTQHIETAGVNDASIRAIISVLNTDDDAVLYWVARSLGNLRERGKIAVPGLPRILPRVDCVMGSKTSASGILFALQQRGVQPPPRTVIRHRVEILVLDETQLSYRYLC